MARERPHLEVISWIAGIVSAGLAAYAFLRPPSSAPDVPALRPVAPQPVVTSLVQTSSPRQVGGSVAPSFDCAKATWKSEKLVCSSLTLAILDRSLANAYSEAVARMPGRALQLKNSQNHWIRKNREACNDIPCAQRVYEIRIEQLKSM